MKSSKRKEVKGKLKLKGKEKGKRRELERNGREIESNKIINSFKVLLLLF